MALSTRHALLARGLARRFMHVRFLSLGRPEMLPSTRALADGVLQRDRAALARAITLVESTRTDHRLQAELLLDHVLAARRDVRLGPRLGAASLRTHPGTPPTFRVGLAGPPGAGKSSLIEALGMYILKQQQQQKAEGGGRQWQPSGISVVAVDPSSSLSGGSILGDKTRMDELSRHPQAYVRPSPTRGMLGGIARDTNDVVLLCEAAGYELVLVETVGLGQSEIAVEGVVDMLVLVVPPGAGDELQGSKKGIVEVADLIAVNKADGDLAGSARHAAAEYSRALQLVRWKHGMAWQPKVLQVSAATGKGLNELWAAALAFREALNNAGILSARRRAQANTWMWSDFEAALVAQGRGSGAVQQAAAALLKPLSEGTMTPRRAAQILLEAFHAPAGDAQA